MCNKSDWDDKAFMSHLIPPPPGSKHNGVPANLLSSTNGNDAENMGAPFYPSFHGRPKARFSLLSSAHSLRLFFIRREFLNGWEKGGRWWWVVVVGGRRRRRADPLPDSSKAPNNASLPSLLPFKAPSSQGTLWLSLFFSHCKLVGGREGKKPTICTYEKERFVGKRKKFTRMNIICTGFYAWGGRRRRIASKSNPLCCWGREGAAHVGRIFTWLLLLLQHNCYPFFRRTTYARTAEYWASHFSLPRYLSPSPSFSNPESSFAFIFRTELAKEYVTKTWGGELL